MRRIEQDEIERIIGKRHLAEVPDDIGPDLQSAPIAKGMRGTVSDYEVASIVKTPIVDAYKIAEK